MRIILSSLFILTAFFCFGEKLISLPELDKPEVIKIDGNNIYIVEKERIFVYSKKDFSLIKKLGKSGNKPGMFKPHFGGKKRIFLDINTNKILITSDERLSIYSKSFNHIKDFKIQPQTNFYYKAENYFIGSNYFFEKGKGKASETVYLFNSRMKYIKILYKSKTAGGRGLRAQRGRKVKYNIIKDYFGYKVFKDKFFIADTSKGFYIEIFSKTGKKIGLINKKYIKQKIKPNTKKDKLNEFKTNDLWKYKKYFKFDFPEYYPSFKNFWISENRIYIETYKIKNKKNEFISLDFKGKTLNKFYKNSTKFNYIFGNTLYYLKKNRHDEWELHQSLLNGINNNENFIKKKNLKNNKRTLLHKAVLAGDIKKVDELIKNVLLINIQDRYGYTPLHYAALKGNKKVIKRLLDNGAKTNLTDHYNCSPLFHASGKGNLEIIKLLLAKNADILIKDKNKNSPYDIASYKGYSKISNLLNPIYRTIKNNDINELKKLVYKNSGIINKKDKFGQTSLHYAYRMDRNIIKNFLISKGAFQNTLDSFGYRPEYYSKNNRNKRLGINNIKNNFAIIIDNTIYKYLKNYSRINIGIIKEGKLVFTKLYGKGNINKTYVYASVSKPVTAMIIINLLEKGKIKSLNDNIWIYSKRYKNCMPKKYKNSPLTLKHLLMYQSGVPHNNKSTWKNGKLNLQIKPGNSYMYSTPGYGILGHIIEDISGLSFNDAVKKYIGNPIGAISFRAENNFKAPGARIHSTIKDMGLFVCGLMNNKYFSKDIFFKQILQHHIEGLGIGWPCKNLNTDNIKVYASGSNGYPQAYIVFNPTKKFGIVLLARTKNRHSLDMIKIGEDLYSDLQNYNEK